ncbi:MAG: hypothetical protein ACXABY_11965 [Candidatus Thorarchaeota archaeon]|jgi:hypothetical protein
MASDILTEFSGENYADFLFLNREARYETLLAAGYTGDFEAMLSEILVDSGYSASIMDGLYEAFVAGDLV